MAKVNTNVSFAITKANILGVVEGISVMLSQHNGGSPTFEELWASESESQKLDIYYREAVSDLETQLRKFSISTITDFALDVSAQDVTISFMPVSFWEARLQNLLSNKVKEYLVHSIIGGWLSDFPDFTHPDYLSLASDDIQAIRDILLERRLDIKDEARTEDADTKDDTSSNRDATERIADEEKPFVQDKLAEYRHLDLTKIKTLDEGMRGMERNKDNATNNFCLDLVDFSNDLM